MTRATCDFAGSYTLSGQERTTVEELLRRLGGVYASAEDPAFLAAARAEAFRCLPTGLVRFLDRFARTEFALVVVVRGLTVDDAVVGPTPPHWRRQPAPDSTRREESFLVLLGSLLGDVFGWSTLQGGRLVQNVLPIQQQEQEQSGHGSLVDLAWHTEDGFHPYRCDYLGLMALRNDERTPTTVAPVDAAILTGVQREVLGQPRFLIYPDNEHVRQGHREGGPDDSGGWEQPAPSAVLFGDMRHPYLRIDPHFMSPLPGDDEASRCLDALVGQLEAALCDLPLDPGEVAFIDNYRAVHGRRSFRPRYDGRDRWLKKVVVTRDLRKSRSARDGVDLRVVLPTARRADAPAPAYRPVTGARP